MAGVRSITNRLQDRGIGGLEAVFAERQAELLRFLRARAPGDDADDLLQDLWLKARAVGSGPIADPAAYLYRMANNLVLDRRRSMVRSQRREHGWAQDVADHELDGSPLSAERILIARDQLRAIDAALAELGERTDRIFRRFRVEGATQDRIARDMGISVSAVEKHLQKAYRALVRIKELHDAE